MKVRLQRASALIMVSVICAGLLSTPVHADFFSDQIQKYVVKFFQNQGHLFAFEKVPKDVEIDSGLFHYSSKVPQNYYTTPTQSVEDKYGNVTNYYRGGDTTTTSIIDSYNKTFNTIHNTTNNTNNYQANVKLSDFLNSYTTNNNNYTYSADFKSWYYDTTTNNYNYSQFNQIDASTTNNNLYYNEDNSKYYITIDNSTDEYYMIDVQYSPTFVTVNYTYNTTNNNITNNVGDVTNVYYFELKDGRNSSELTASEVAGLDLGYDVVNYELVPDDPNTLSLQHFDGDYNDSSTYNREFYSVNRSTTYGDAGDFGGAVQLVSGASAGVKIPDLSSYDGLQFDFRIRYNNASSLLVYLGNTCIFREIRNYKEWEVEERYTDNYMEKTVPYSSTDAYMPPKSTVTTISGGDSIPTSFNSYGGKLYSYSPKRYGYEVFSGAPFIYGTPLETNYWVHSGNDPEYTTQTYALYHWRETKYRLYSSSSSIRANFNHSNYVDKWLPMRITIKDGNLYYFVNGDLVGSGPFTMPENADKFYIKSSGTLWLDELRISTGDLVSTTAYTPSSSPYDTNMVLALPDELKANTIYVQHATPISAHRIGGVRPSAPTTGFFYIPLHSDYTGGQPQLYDGANWVNVTAMVYDGKALHDALGYKFSPVGSSPDVVEDLKPGGSTSQDPETCTHEWVELERKDPTCILSGSVTSGCRKCKKEKTENLPKLGHTWEIKQSVQTTYDEAGNVLTEGFTIYRCATCGEEYKDTDGKGPPGGSSGSSDGEESGGFLGWLAEKIGALLGSIGNGLITLIQTTLGKIFDGLIALVDSTIANLTKVVDLFSSFGDAIGVLWTWLPPEIVSVLVAAVTVLIFLALIRIFLK